MSNTTKINITAYFADVWNKAVHDAYSEVIRLTASIPGGKRKDEELEEYVKRVRAFQDEALAKYKLAKAELELYSSSDESDESCFFPEL